MELFNLDELAKVKRTVVLFGNTYDVAERTVGQMVNALRVAKKAEVASPDEILEEMLDTAHNIIPDCPMDNIKRLNMRQLTALIQYASKPDEQVIAEKEAEEEQGKSE
ncbi:conserved hypothetical protein [Vibrio coralliirubri]|uniref:hypothetical protein n=1 Tax=Vibrio coralliirubri TaxID=1516159 RepID=UPI0006375D1D|nr:hypothetical protein [Vibrio coralliirubri]CDT52546.1 conserved hypothetical protein [Vibrio coralliirubri]